MPAAAMAYNFNVKGRPVRPLGSVRQGFSQGDSVPKFPPLKSGTDSGEMGVHGNAMAVPPQRHASPERQVPQKETSNTRPSPKVGSDGGSRRSMAPPRSDSLSSGRSGTGDSKDKELKDAMAREKQLKQQVMSLQKVIDELKAQLRDRDKTVAELQLQFSRQEEQYKVKVEQEMQRHEETRQQLNTANSQVNNVNNKLEEVLAQHEIKVQQLNTMLETRVAELTTEKEKEIALRDEKLNRLKSQMADALKGNSWERQQQLDELTKELGKVQEEADSLRIKLKALQKASKTGGCGNCETMTSQLSLQQRSVKDKDATIKELKSLCAKFEKQLTQQDDMLRQYAESRKNSTAMFTK